jgi:FixJ family two-component response regulator
VEGYVVSDKKQIYIVDDDESVCRAMSILLATYGFTVKAFTCTKDFFCGVPNSVTGCLILDIHMSGMDGWETLKRIIKSGFKLTVIIVSADKNEGLDEKALKAGAMGFLQKPFKGQVLVDLIETAFKKEEKHA